MSVICGPRNIWIFCYSVCKDQSSYKLRVYFVGLFSKGSNLESCNPVDCESDSSEQMGKPYIP